MRSSAARVTRYPGHLRHDARVHAADIGFDDGRCRCAVCGADRAAALPAGAARPRTIGVDRMRERSRHGAAIDSVTISLSYDDGPLSHIDLPTRRPVKVI